MPITHQYFFIEFIVVQNNNEIYKVHKINSLYKLTFVDKMIILFMSRRGKSENDTQNNYADGLAGTITLSVSLCEKQQYNKDSY